MRVYEPTPSTGAATIRRYPELGDHVGDPEDAARAWTEAGFDDDATSRWLTARCFDPQAARELAEAGVSPEQAGKRTRDGGGGYVDTIAFKVSSGDLTPRQGAARTLSSR